MIEKIQNGLKEIEKIYGVRILYAVESGSRVWGFASKDSDWDVRFIYVASPSYYLSIADKADHIDRPPVNTKDLDFAGWDLRKALRLFKKSNPPLLEWLNSDQIYIEGAYPIPEMRTLKRSAFNTTAAIYHYLNMAKGNYRTYLREESVWLKKYFYVIRPILCCEYIEKHHCEPPVQFKLLLDYSQTPPPIFEMTELLELKINGAELGYGEQRTSLNKWIEGRLEHFDKRALVRGRNQEEKLGSLDYLFANTVLQCNYS